eukprot:Skav200784  [mRNA]  locus=scaffold2001:675989:676192:+ [translate_table: standard]
MKVYVAPSAEELTPGSAAFKARVAKVKEGLKPPRLVTVGEAVEMIKSLGCAKRELLIPSRATPEQTS